MGVKPVVGREFLASNAVGTGELEVVLSHGFWQRRFAADPSVVGRAITLGDRSYMVVGVAPEEFWYPSRAVELWVAYDFAAYASNRNLRACQCLARLRPGVTTEQAQAELETITGRLAKDHAENRGWSATAKLWHKL